MPKKKQTMDPASVEGQGIWARSELARPGLLERTLDDENLLAAIEVVRQAGAEAGPDGLGLEEGIAAFEDAVDETVGNVLRGGYVPGGVRILRVEGHDGEERQVAVPCMRDRILQQAFLQKLSPIFDAFRHSSRKAESRPRVVEAARELDSRGYHFAARVYLSRQMDPVQRQQFVAAVRRFVDDERVVQVVRAFVKSGIMAEGAVAEPALAPRAASPLGVLLADMYLDALDQEMARKQMPIVRYADEILVFAPSERAAQLAQMAACQFLKDRLRVSVRGKRTDIVPSAQVTTSL